MAGDTRIRFGKARIEHRGFTELFKRIDRVGLDTMEVSKDVFAAATKRVLARSQALVPVDRGHLRASGRVSKPRVNKRTRVVTASVNYGGAVLKRLAPDEPEIYGIVVHEDPTGRGFKFLERPMVAEKAAVMEELRRRIASKLGRRR